MKATFSNFQLLADKELYEAMVEKYGTQSYGEDKLAIKTNNSFASWMIAERVGDKYKITPISSQNNERQSLQMEAYWTTLKDFPIKEFNDVPQFYRQWFVNRGLMKEEAERDYKDEYKKFQSSKKSKKYRAELNKYNRDKGTYGNGDGKDASHKGGKISGFEDESTNKGRREKSRLKKENEMNEDKQRTYIDKIEKILLNKFHNTKEVKKLMDKYSLYVYDMLGDQPPETVAKNILNKKVPKNYVKENVITKERLREIIIEEYQRMNEQKVAVYFEAPTGDFMDWADEHDMDLAKLNKGKYMYQRMIIGNGNKKEIWMDNEKAAKTAYAMMNKGGLKPKGVGERNGFVKGASYSRKELIKKFGR